MSLKKKMNKVLIGLSIVAILVIIAKLTHALQWYNIPTTSNESTIKRGSLLFATNLKKPERFNFIAYYQFDSIFDKEAIFVHRLCGLGGDTILIKSGVLYVNGISTDNEFDLKLSYQIPNNQFSQIQHALSEEESQFVYMDTSQTTLPLRRDIISKYSLQATRKIIGPDEINEYIQGVHKKPWNQDHFGPIIIPEGYYFVLGDNRYAANDSRFSGLIPTSKLIGTVIGK